MKILKLGLIVIIAISLNSCAIMFNGVKQNVSVTSMTSGSKIYIDGNLEGTDAVSVKLRRKDNHTVIVKKDGCETKTVQIDTNVQAGWIVFDALFNWFAFLTDAPTGAWKGFDKTKITVDLDCNK
jgi:hypothetical protein